MSKKLGKVIEVFIPNEKIDSNKIGFKVMLDTKIIEIMQDQNEENTNIYRDDLVVITKQIISNKEFIDIDKCYGKAYE